MKHLNKMLAILLALTTLFLFAACSSGGEHTPIANDSEAPVKGEGKILVAYFSWSGNTQTMANWVVEKTGGELFRIVPEVAYTQNDVFDRSKNELDNGIRPAIITHIDAEVMAGYDTVFLGFPIWWYDLPMPVWTFLEEYDVSGKTVIPFFTHNGSSSGAGSLGTLEKLLPSATVRTDDALSVAGNSVSGAENKVDSWLSGLGYKK